MSKKLLVEISAFLCAVLFIMVGLSKLIGHHDFSITLGKSPIVGRYVSWLSIVLPIVEILAGSALLVPRFRKIGFTAISIMMIVFTAYNIYLVKFAPYVPCSCGGIFNKLTWTKHLYVNTFFTILALTGWWLSKRHLMNYHKPNT